ncbi:MAG: YqiA/YcfP family alpha/beta fold hydrolase [Gammaproteobacteria bacterium]|nr:YqiA/YcfP family alpha/beta fold hydrolase [Gammaproteobacteria bacterium]
MFRSIPHKIPEVSHSSTQKSPASLEEDKKENKSKFDAPNFTEKYRQFSSNNLKAALLIHGGCFTQGDETWNNEQAQSIAENCNLDVFTLNFSKTSLFASIKDIKDFFLDLYKFYDSHVGLIGCSSGGYLTLRVLEEVDMPQFVFLICPVMDPTKREDMLLAADRNSNSLNIQQQQFTYFKSKPYPQANSTRLPFHIIAAKDDENVPLILISNEAKRYPHAALHIIEGNHSHSYKSTSEVNKIIHDVLKKPAETRAPIIRNN